MKYFCELTFPIFSKMKKKIPQLTTKGISGDYSNELQPIVTAMDAYERDYDIWKNIGFLKKYQERYPPSEYSNVITEKNKKSILKLDKIVDEINGMLLENSRDSAKYEKLIKNIVLLIYGRTSNN